MEMTTSVAAAIATIGSGFRQWRGNANRDATCHVHISKYRVEPDLYLYIVFDLHLLLIGFAYHFH